MSLPTSIAVAFSVLLSFAAHAQQPAYPDPARADEAVAAPVYQSAFADYQPLRDVEKTPLESWRAANDEVARIGGHAGSLKQAATPASDKPAQPDAHGAHRH
jgi:hypothetical protein